VKELIGYKVVGRNFGSMTRDIRRAGVKYRIKKWVSRRRGCGPLAVFGTLERAINFAKINFDDYFIYKVKYTESKEHSLWDFNHENCFLPEGTLLATSVMLLKRYNVMGD
jgi:hypothetical protein